MAKKVLHVDRDVSFLLVAKKILQLLGNFEIDLATSVLEANEALKNKQYDVILSGYCLGEKNGLEFLTEVREKGDNVPFIMFSVHNELASNALKLGATKFIDKKNDCESVYANLVSSIKEA